MKKLLLRNSLAHNGAWFLTAAAFAVAGLASFCGLVIANVRDPKAVWMGSSVQSPQLIYLFLDVLALLVGLGLGFLAIRFGKKLLDRSVQVSVDEAGIHDHRSEGEEVLWPEVTAVDVAAQHSPQGALIGTKLEVVTKAGRTVAVDVFNLDQDHKGILRAVKHIWRGAKR
jgi:hypothetical protein